MNLELEPPQSSSGSDLESVELVFKLLDLLAGAHHPLGVAEIARALNISKPRAHRHLRAFLRRNYARQDPRTSGYEIGSALLSLGERARERFDVIAAIRPHMGPLRDATELTVTASALNGEEVLVLEMLHGSSVIEWGVRPGSRLDLHASAHGLVALAFGPPHLFDAAISQPLKAWTERTIIDADTLRENVARVRRNGWATAADAVQVGANALAAPVRDHRGVCRGAIALVGSTQLIPAQPSDEHLKLVTAAAGAASRSLGWGAA